MATRSSICVTAAVWRYKGGGSFDDPQSQFDVYTWQNGSWSPQVPILRTGGVRLFQTSAHCWDKLNRAVGSASTVVANFDEVCSSCSALASCRRGGRFAARHQCKFGRQQLHPATTVYALRLFDLSGVGGTNGPLGLWDVIVEAPAGTRWAELPRALHIRNPVERDVWLAWSGSPSVVLGRPTLTG